MRANKIGKATFLSLDKMEGFTVHMNKPFDAPAGTKRLFDLIQIKNEIYKPAFYQALKDTLVCSDIDLATQVKKRGKNKETKINSIIITITYINDN